MITSNPTNADRAQWAKNALAVFTAETYSGDHPDRMHPDDLETAIGDLIADLLHLAILSGIAPLEVHNRALDHFHAEFPDAGATVCTCRERRWYGERHDSQCPIRIAADAHAGATRRSPERS